MNDLPATLELPTQTIVQHIIDIWPEIERVYDEHVETDDFKQPTIHDVEEVEVVNAPESHQLDSEGFEGDDEDVHGTSESEDSSESSHDTYAVRVFAITEGKVSERTARATHWQPAEYKHHTVDIFWEILWFPNYKDQTFDGCEVFVRQEDFPTAPPVPDI